MSAPDADPPPRSRGRGLARGHSIAEVTVGLVLVSVVLSSIGAALMDQRRFYASQTQIVDTRDAARIALEVLSRELREASPSQGDLYAIAPDSLALRAFQGLGVLCARDGARIRIWSVSGVFGEAWRDSALVYVENRPETASDDAWLALGIADAQGAGTAECLGADRPQLALGLDRDPGPLPVGTPVRAFRPFVYRLYRAGDGRWWLGQRLRGGAIQPVAGPFEPPEAGGLRFEYLTREDAPALGPGDVARVRIDLRARSMDRLRMPRSSGHYTDALSSLVTLRNE